MIMSEELNVKSGNKLNKKMVGIAVAIIAMVTIVAIVLIAPASARAKEVQEKLSLGDKYLSELNYEQAEAMYLAILEIDPKCEDAYIGLADVYIATGEYEKAEEILKKAEEQLGGETENIRQKREELAQKRKEQELLAGLHEDFKVIISVEPDMPMEIFLKEYHIPYKNR